MHCAVQDEEAVVVLDDADERDVLAVTSEAITEALSLPSVLAVVVAWLFSLPSSGKETAINETTPTEPISRRKSRRGNASESATEAAACRNVWEVLRTGAGCEAGGKMDRRATLTIQREWRPIFNTIRIRVVIEAVACTFAHTA